MRYRNNNRSDNAPMLAINRKLGYRPEPGQYHLHKSIVNSSGPDCDLR